MNILKSKEMKTEVGKQFLKQALRQKKTKIIIMGREVL